MATDISHNPNGAGSRRRTISFNINREAYNISQFNENFVRLPSRQDSYKPDLTAKTWVRRVRSLFPITIWLPEYDIKQNLWADILVGITIAVFQVPQSMGYCLIANVPPVYGLYSAFFPALFYSILGTGLHCAFGPFALVSGIMTGDIINQVMAELGKVPDPTPIGTIITGATTSPDDPFPNLKNIEIAIMVAIIIGSYIGVFGVLRLGFVSSFMSEELISGFTTSASILVFVSQIRYLLGVNLSHFSGPFNLMYALVEVFERIKEVNLTTFTISVICLTVLLFFKLIVNPRTAKYIKTPFPIELVTVIVATFASNYLDLKHPPYNVKIVGEIGDSFPDPLIPKWSLWPIMWQKCIATAIVGYTITLSVCKIYGKKHGYKVDANQEMIAMGASNVFSAFFQCIPSAASLPRSALQETAGGKTQVVSLVNCLCIVFVILFLGKYLSELPRMIWLITFSGVLILNVEYGIYLGIICSLLLLIYKSQRTEVYLLGSVEDMDIYVPINKYHNVCEKEGFKIFQMCGPLNFSNVDYFSTQLEDKCNINYSEIRKYMTTEAYKTRVEMLERNSYQTLPKLVLTRLALNDKLPKYLIIDCSMFSFIDYSGITTLKKTILTLEEIGIKTVLSGVHVHIESMFVKEGFFDVIPSEHLYKSVHDAVLCLEEFDSEFNHFTIEEFQPKSTHSNERTPLLSSQV